MTRKRRAGERDQYASAFNPSLNRLCEAVGATGAALVDGEGETVDYAGALTPFDIRIAAAHWVIVLAALRASRAAALAVAEEVVVRASRKTYALFTLEDGYALVIQLPRHAFHVSRRAMNEALRALCGESGLRVPHAIAAGRESWSSVRVAESSHPRRPTAVLLDEGWTEVQVLGRWSSRSPESELGFRCRLANGAEMTLVRERLGRWYTDIPVAVSA